MDFVSVVPQRRQGGECWVLAPMPRLSPEGCLAMANIDHERQSSTLTVLQEARQVLASAPAQGGR